MPLAKWLKEKQWGLTTGEQLLVMVGKDLAEKTWQAISIKTQLKGLLEFLKEQTKIKQAQGGAQQPSPSPSTEGVPHQPGNAGSRTTSDASGAQSVEAEELDEHGNPTGRRM